MSGGKPGCVPTAGADVSVEGLIMGPYIGTWAPAVGTQPGFPPLTFGHLSGTVWGLCGDCLGTVWVRSELDERMLGVATSTGSELDERMLGVTTSIGVELARPMRQRPVTPGHVVFSTG